MVQILRRRYHRHLWYEYVPTTRQENNNTGVEVVWDLREAPLNKEIDMSQKSMTWERDRDIVRFLERQARLL